MPPKAILSNRDTFTSGNTFWMHQFTTKFTQPSSFTALRVRNTKLCPRSAQPEPVSLSFYCTVQRAVRYTSVCHRLVGPYKSHGNVWLCTTAAAHGGSEFTHTRTPWDIFTHTIFTPRTHTHNFHTSHTHPPIFTPRPHTHTHPQTFSHLMHVRTHTQTVKHKKQHNFLRLILENYENRYSLLTGLVTWGIIPLNTYT